MSEQPARSSKPVTAIFARVVKPGREAEYAAWTEGVVEAARDFEGFVGEDIMSSHDHDHAEHVIIIHFDTFNNLRRWLASKEREAWLERAKPLTVGRSRLRVTSGLEYWFDVPGEPGLPAPPRYKQAIVTWLALLPLVHFIPSTLGLVLNGWPRLLLTGLGTGVIVAIMTYLWMPFMTRLFGGWLHR